MAKPASLALDRGSRALYWAEQVAIVVSASLFVALCARVTVPLPFTPVPLTLQNFGVLLVGLTLGSRRGFAALALYLVEGASGMPVFNPAGPGGVAQLSGCDRRLPAGLSLRRRAGGLDHGARQDQFRSRRYGRHAGGSGVVRRRPFMAGGADPLFRPGGALGALLVRVRGSDQGHVGRWSLNRMAACPQGAGMSFVETPSGTTAALAPETKDSSRGIASTREISIAHSPDSDDAFMFYGLATNKVRVPGLRFTHTLCDIETLNRRRGKATAFMTSRPSRSTPIPTFRTTTLCCRAAAASATATAP